ncbi:MAG: ABC transporter permease [Lachnospiraceae bacterium]|nr:ABC transporter permease [Lachnospiraceae bacterium]
MLTDLSVRNARRQFREYILYFITLSCTVSFMYAFNALIFSDIVEELSNLEILPYMISAASGLIIIVMGWIISYMANYMLKKRSREFSIYMISGVSNHMLGKLIYRENVVIGLLAFGIGLPAGVLLAQLLEAVVLHMFGKRYVLSVQFSFNAAGLTVLYFFIMLWYSLRKNRKWIKKLKLYDLIYCDRKNETELFHGSLTAFIIFVSSMILGAAGCFLIYSQIMGKGLDTLVGTIFLAVCLFGFFLSVPTYLGMKVRDCSGWKYQKNRLIPFRGFMAKIQSMTITMGILSVLFMIVISFLGIGILVNRVAGKSIELNPFDIVILHNKEAMDFSDYDTWIRNQFSVRESYSYSIYTNGEKKLLALRNQNIIDYGMNVGFSYAEYQNDTYMKQSDYIRLREMLNFEDVNLNSDCCYIHCLPALEADFKEYIDGQGADMGSNGYLFAENGVFHEPFNQMEAYGNGLNYIIIVPDQAISDMEVLYSLYVAAADTTPDSGDLKRMIDECSGLVQLDRSIGRNDPDNNGYTSLIVNKDYLSGKWVEKGSLSHLYAMSICLFYFAFVLEITGASILATQVLSDKDKKQKQDCILRQLGMRNQFINKVNSRQLSMLFIIPVLPSLIVSGCFVYVSAVKIQTSAFYLPVFENNLWIVQSFGGAVLLFIVLYGIYYMAARMNYKNI